MNEISQDEIDARIMALISQRNRALDENVILAGRVSLLEKQLKELQQKLVQLPESPEKS